MLETSTNDFVAAGGLGLRGRAMLLVVMAASVGTTFGLGGCATAAPNGQPELHASFGEATAQNRAAQFVAPTEAQKQNTYIRPNAARQRLALKTYEAGEVEVGEASTD